MRDMSKYFDGYENRVPANIKEIAIAIMRRFSIFGLCDGMYIANTIAFHNGIGDGESHFTGTEITDSSETAKALRNAYGCNIMQDEVKELREIILSGGKLNKRDTLYGLERYVRKCKEEKFTADEWRQEYLDRCIKEAEATIIEEGGVL